MTEQLTSWLKDNKIKWKPLLGELFLIEQLGNCIECNPEGDVLKLNKDRQYILQLTDQDRQYIATSKVDYVVFKFGSNFFYTNAINHQAEFNVLKYIGICNEWMPQNEEYRVFLGVHGRYEIMNGTRDYSDWCSKAKFLGINTLGIVEHQTLAGTLPFQLACDKSGINSVIGYSLTVEDELPFAYQLKLFPINQQGWQDLLTINYSINVLNQPFGLGDCHLLENMVVCADVLLVHYADRIQLLNQSAHRLFIRLTDNEYFDDEYDRLVLQAMQKYINHLWQIIDPIIINDAYVLDKDDIDVKNIMNKQGSVKVGKATLDHYFKSQQEQMLIWSKMFPDSDPRLKKLFVDSLKSHKQVVDLCKFKIDVNQLHLPKYEMTDQQRIKFADNQQLFDHLIRQQLGKKVDVTEEVTNRVSEEVRVIKLGGFIDYFLILWDIINWCNENEIQTGPGRGSAAGCLVSYLLGIVKINPLEYGLLFERFLNEARVKSSMPDIDIDFASDRRDEVIEYMQKRYGEDFVCRVGTYTTLQMRGLIKELARVHGVQGGFNMNIVNKLIETDNEKWEAIFQDAANERMIKRFIQQNPVLINQARVSLNTIKANSMHACATIIAPKRLTESGEVIPIHQQFPVRLDESGMLVSEWEGPMLERAGFLKEDILSTRQMAKIGHIFDLVEHRTGKRLSMEEIPLDDPNVYSLFCKGLNQDVFHFGSSGLTSYLIKLQPKNINDLIAAIALFRPGAMASKAHEEYVKLKNGEIQPQYDYMLEEVTKETYGLYIYQEQVMKAAQVLGGFSLADADGVRKAMGKKIKSKMDGYKIQFIQGAVSKGCPQQEAEEIWTKMEVFSGYGFNKSHAASYSVIGYYCNWLKLHYPLEFWTVAFQHTTSDQKLQLYVNEIKKTGGITIVPPEINKSNFEFQSDQQQLSIIWNLSRIKYIGDVAAQAIIDERDQNGKFFSFKEFIQRVPKAKVNVRCIKHLVLAGCFDQIENIREPKQRFKLIEQMDDPDLTAEFYDMRNVNYYWSLMQNEISQLSDMNYHQLIRLSSASSYAEQYMSIEEFQQLNTHTAPILLTGIVTDVTTRKTKKGDTFAMLTLLQEQFQVQIRVWPNILTSPDVRLDQLKDLVDNKYKALCVARGLFEDNPYTNQKELVLSTKIGGALFETFTI